MELRPGRVITTKLRKTPTDAPPHPFVHLIFYDSVSEEAIISHLTLSISPPNFMQRLLHQGYDLAPTALPSTRSIFGRCWRIHPSHTEEHIGALWDYPGHLGNLSSSLSLAQPHPQATVALYKGSTDPIYLAVGELFRTTRTVCALRDGLEGLGLLLIPKMYEPS
ncbi:hypothetical protein PAPYR_5403 [Paratrimastix pyriformis]|uniref:Uncharacterized protein n=1 Tax=Paratrimastix pyriformis TaxID=342808 RepID=A0ABQ8UKB9_9EUKA|nr:hypothetical protein PAPYR_5403 [Paratrimastix pyriformis]